MKLSSVSSVKASLTFILHHQRNGKLIDNKMFFCADVQWQTLCILAASEGAEPVTIERIDHRATLFILLYYKSCY